MRKKNTNAVEQEKESKREKFKRNEENIVKEKKERIRKMKERRQTEEN